MAIFFHPLSRLFGRFAVVQLAASAICAQAALPPDAQKLLETFPEKSVTLDLVISRAIEASDSYRVLQSTLPMSEIPALQAMALLDTRLFARASRSVNENEPQTPFNPNSIKANAFSVGAATVFRSGTAASIEISQGFNELGFPTVPATSFHETRASLNLTQNLWQDGFGLATRKGLESGDLQRQSAIGAHENAVEEWVFGLVQVFHGAWLAQAQTQAAHDNAMRRQRLLDITSVKARRGTAEEPDLLQVRSAVTTSDVQAREAAQVLQDRWQALVTSLKMPERWLAINPVDIPIGLDDPSKGALERARRACSEFSGEGAGMPENAAIREADLKAEAARAGLARADNLMSPDLDLNLGLSANGIDAEKLGSALEETGTLDHPGWTLGVSFSYPLGQHAEKAALVAAKAENTRAEAAAAQTRDLVRLDWLKACSDFKRLMANHAALDEAYRNQQKRAQLEEDRFRTGSTPTLAVIQAGDDVTLAEFSLRRAEAERRIAGWKVLKLKDGFRTYLSALASAQRRIE